MGAVQPQFLAILPVRAIGVITTIIIEIIVAVIIIILVVIAVILK